MKILKFAALTACTLLVSQNYSLAMMEAYRAPAKPVTKKQAARDLQSFDTMMQAKNLSSLPEQAKLQDVIKTLAEKQTSAKRPEARDAATRQLKIAQEKLNSLTLQEQSPVAVKETNPFDSKIKDLSFEPVTQKKPLDFSNFADQPNLRKAITTTRDTTNIKTETDLNNFIQDYKTGKANDLDLQTFIKKFLIRAIFQQ